MKLKISPSCPNCNHKLQIELNQMYQGNYTICPNCEAQINFEGDDGRKTQKAMDDFSKSLKQMFK